MSGDRINPPPQTRRAFLTFFSTEILGDSAASERGESWGITAEDKLDRDRGVEYQLPPRGPAQRRPRTRSRTAGCRGS